MAKGGYRGGSTLIGRQDQGWFGKAKHVRPKSPTRMSLPELRAEIAAGERRADELRRECDRVLDQLRELRVAESVATEQAKFEQPMRSAAPDPLRTQRTLTALEQEIDALFRNPAGRGRRTQ